MPDAPTPQNTQDASAEQAARRARQLAGLQPFSKDYQPKRRGHNVDGAKLYRWAGKLPAPESIVSNLRKMFPGVSPRKKITLDEARRIRMYLEAIQGNVQANKEIDDRLYGKAKESIDHSTLGEKISQNIYNILSSEQQGKIERANNNADEI